MLTATFAAFAIYVSSVACVCVEGLEYLQSLNLERVVMCQLNPLKLCLPTVTSMFAAITRYRLLIKLVIIAEVLLYHLLLNIPVIFELVTLHTITNGVFGVLFTVCRHTQ